MCVTAGSCTHVVVLDRLDTYVAASFARFDIRPQCIRYVDHIRGQWQADRQCRIAAGLTSPGDPINFHLMAVSSKDLRTPLGGKRIDMVAVDRDGVPIPDGSVSISPQAVTTNVEGRNAEPVTITATRPGDYRVRLSYPDRHTQTVGYSPVLHVITTSNPPN